MCTNNLADMCNHIPLVVDASKELNASRCSLTKIPYRLGNRDIKLSPLMMMSEVYYEKTENHYRYMISSQFIFYHYLSSEHTCSMKLRGGLMANQITKSGKTLRMTTPKLAVSIETTQTRVEYIIGKIMNDDSITYLSELITSNTKIAYVETPYGDQLTILNNKPETPRKFRKRNPKVVKLFKELQSHGDYINTYLSKHDGINRSNVMMCINILRTALDLDRDVIISHIHESLGLSKYVINIMYEYIVCIVELVHVEN